MLSSSYSVNDTLTCLWKTSDHTSTRGQVDQPLRQTKDSSPDQVESDLRQFGYLSSAERTGWAWKAVSFFNLEMELNCWQNQKRLRHDHDYIRFDCQVKRTIKGGYNYVVGFSRHKISERYDR